MTIIWFNKNNFGSVSFVVNFHMVIWLQDQSNEASTGFHLCHTIERQADKAGKMDEHRIRVRGQDLQKSVKLNYSPPKIQPYGPPTLEWDYENCCCHCSNTECAEYVLFLEKSIIIIMMS